MRTDFEKAKSSLSHIMKGWQFVHNFIDGLPTEAVEELSRFKGELLDVEFSFFGIARFREIMATLPESELERLLGPLARQNDFHNLQMSEVKELVDAIVSDIVDYAPKTQTISPVSSSKLDFNKIPEMWASPLRSGRYNEHLIQDYFSNHPLPTQGEILAKHFNDKYLEFANQKLKPSTIMSELYLQIVGPDEQSIERQVAAYTILAYLFERCDIFENATDG